MGPPASGSCPKGDPGFRESVAWRGLRRNWIRSWLAVVLAWIAAAPAGSTPDLEFRLELEHATYARGQPIVCRMILANASSRPIRVNRRMLVNGPAPEPHEVLFRVVGPAGQPLLFDLLVRAGGPDPEDFTPLAPGERTVAYCDLAYAYAIQQPGAYRAQAVYETVGPGGWAGRLTSNEVEFHVE